MSANTATALAPWVQRASDSTGRRYLLGTRSFLTLNNSEHNSTSTLVETIRLSGEADEYIYSTKDSTSDYINAYFRFRFLSVEQSKEAELVITFPSHERNLGVSFQTALGDMGTMAALASYDELEKILAEVEQGIPIVRIAYDDPYCLPADLQRAMQTNPLIWIGYAYEQGLHVGPIITDEESWNDYRDATWAWSGEQLKLSYGFTSLAVPIRTGKESITGLASALALLLKKRSRNTVVMSEGQTPRILWTELHHRQIREEELDRVKWPKGLVRNLTVTDTGLGTYLASCVSPCEGIAGLEGNSGKHATSEHAVAGALGEVIERFAAWHSQNLGIPPCDSEKIPLEKFHPHGPIYDRSDSSAIEYVEGTSLIDGRKLAIPKSLATFPYIPDSDYRKPTYGHTTGLASHYTLEEAVFRGACEILERDNFYGNFLNQRCGTLIDYECYEDSTEFYSVVFGTTPVPIVHTFIINQQMMIAARGSGSGNSLSQALECSKEEAVQVFSQVKRGAPPTEAAKSYGLWRSKNIITELRSYLQEFKVSLIRNDAVDHSKKELLETIREFAIETEREYGYVSLKSPVEGRISIRVFMTDMICHQWSSESLAGNRILNPKWRHGSPT